MFKSGLLTAFLFCKNGVFSLILLCVHWQIILCFCFNIDMKLQSVYTPLKNYFNVVRNSFVCASKCESVYVEGGAEALAQQNKILVRSANRVEPERVNFNSTKEMFEYAKSKVISPLQGEAPSEYTVVMNVKEKNYS